MVLSRRVLRTAIATLLLSNVLHVAPRPSFADAASKKRAYELYQQSVEKYRAGQFKEAAALLREAYAAEPDPVLLYNLGRACEGMGDDACAVDAYERYLAGASPPDRGAIEKKVAIMKSRLSTPKPVETPIAPPKDQEPAPHVQNSPWPWVVAGVGAAALTTGVVLGFSARAKHDDAVDDPVQESAARTHASAQSTMRAANVLLIVGGVVTVTGLAWKLFERSDASPKAKSNASASVRVGPGSLWLSVQF